MSGILLISSKRPRRAAPHIHRPVQIAVGANLTAQSTGHATFVEAADGAWYASFIARRNTNGSSPLGRERFLTEVTCQDDGWPVMNGGGPILLCEEVGTKAGPKKVRAPWTDRFSGPELNKSWYQIRTPYTNNYDIYNGRLVFRPSVFGLSVGDTPTAVFRKQTSLNMAFSTELLGSKGCWGRGIWLHEDFGVRECVNVTGNFLYSEARQNGTVDVSLSLAVKFMLRLLALGQYWQLPLNQSDSLPDEPKLDIRVEPLVYRLGYSFDDDAPTFVVQVASLWQISAPAGWFVFTGSSFALFATGEGEPWPYNCASAWLHQSDGDFSRGEYS
ncbi:Non-reducing end alpha-L-arabinofuranosidase BoGH43A 4 [Colletotrichum chlorophyti]|uniref:Non-reducing end alpha-L-arabinofuranosidase BoGH43A 4 n=1 Tax=Colletotrichum chlorophyti TaxID=708187 RepID=A0A1Q8S926_9PEZI|nr:Non-reducing end alpha-L-arabinofuranosidase BoGH43A 4 [Colletotrichum chlorophyti]